MLIFIKILILFIFINGEHDKCLVKKNIVQYKNYNLKSSCLEIHSNYLKLNKKYKISLDFVVDAKSYIDSISMHKVDTSISNFFYLLPITNNGGNLENAKNSDNQSIKYSNEKKTDIEFYYLGNIEYNSDFRTNLFLIKDSLGAESIHLKIFAVNSYNNCLMSIAILSTYSHFWGMTNHITAKYDSGNYFFLKDHGSSDVTFSKEGLKELSKKQKRIKEFGYCARLIFDSKGMVKIVR